MILSGVPEGSFGRWAFGVTILTSLIAFNESGTQTTLVAVIIASLNSILMVFCKSGLNQLQIPYLRASHRSDFLCLFLALWMELLALVATCASFCRTISFCLDAMSGGLVRLYILGRNSSINEPWPDVLGVVIVFIISGMFILGLENSKIFSCLAVTSALGISGLLATVTYLRGNIDTWTRDDNHFPKGLQGILSASALLLISFPNNLPTTGRYPKLKAVMFAGVVLISISLITGCLSTLMQMSTSHNYETVPILRILETKDLHKFIPPIACLYVVSSSAALLEIFTETFQIIVRFATSEWKILLKQISYESHESGSPVLAIFVSGSLVAILAFTCPLENMTYIIAGSQLSSGVLRAFFFLYSPFRPKSMNPKKDSSQAYSRLEASGNKKPSISKRTSMWFLNKAVPSISTHNLSKSISKLNKSEQKEEMEKEWLLLDGGEPSSPLNQADHREPINAESTILSDVTTSDTECIGMVKAENSDSESEEEDIDSVVEEYQQKVKVSTAGLREMNLKLPSSGSWRASQLCIFSVFMSGVGASISAYCQLIIPFVLSFAVVLVMSSIMMCIPRYTYSHDTPAIFICTLSFLFNCIFLSTMMFDSWLAIIFWFVSGIVLAIQSMIKCDVWCCLCLEYSRHSGEPTVLIEENLIPNGSSRLATATIRLKNPPIGSSVINQVQSRR